MRTVSDSEVSAYLKCERVHMFSYGYGFRPKEVSLPLDIGTIGHRVLGEYYQALKDGLPHAACVQKGMEITAEYMDDEYSKAIPIVSERFLKYALCFKNEFKRIIAVEEPFVCELMPGIGFKFVPDLVVELPTGEVQIWEHKWGYNFWSQDDAYDMAQAPKYIWGMRQLGYPVTKACINQLRYRAIKEPSLSQIFKRNHVSPTDTRLENIMEVHRRAATRIVNLPEKEIWKEEALPAQNKINCKDCFFRVPCRHMLDGVDPRKTLTAFYDQKLRVYE